MAFALGSLLQRALAAAGFGGAEPELSLKEKFERDGFLVVRGFSSGPFPTPC
jgi:Holliday junction resolvase